MTTTMLQAATRREQAESRLLVIRNALEVADAELAAVLANEDWVVFGLSSFREYCREMLPELRHISLRKDAREARIDALLGADPTLTIPDLVEATGSSLGTVHAYLKRVQGGRSRAARPERRGPRKTDRTVELLMAAGPEGMDVREVAKALRCDRNKASATLTRLHDAGRIGYVAPERRGLFGRYVAVPSPGPVS